MRATPAGLAGAILVSCLYISGTPCRGALLINEVFYDPVGPDAGREWIEITNTGPFAATLEGLSLESGNGGRENDWREGWRGRGERWIEPGGYYRIGAAGPGPGEEAELGLQNGPDGVRLVKQGFELDRVGWGAHRFPEYYEGNPAASVRSGSSLARRVDGADSDDNATDFEDAAPTPGRPNRPANDWAIRFGAPMPELPRPGALVLIPLVVANRGVSEGLPPPAEVRDTARAIRVDWVASVRSGGTASQVVLLSAPADTGRAVWRASLLANDQVPENDADSLLLCVGTGPVRISEILASPRDGGCEWIELSISLPDNRIVSGLALDVRGRTIALAPRRVGPATRVAVVAEDSTLLRQGFPDLPAAANWPFEGSWPRLRNGERSAGVSDTLRLRGSDGLVVELALPGPAPAAGVSLERLGVDLPEGPSAWIPCADPAGATPGKAGAAAAAVAAAPADEFHAEPRVIHPATTTCTFACAVGARPGLARLDLFDLAGNEVRCLVRDLWVVGHLLATWDGTDEMDRSVAPGVYIAVLEVSRSGGEIQRWRTAVAVAPGADR